MNTGEGRGRIRIEIFLFILAVAFSAVVTWNASLNFIDSDASSELVLANHLHQTGQVLSRDWYYSTELRALNTQLVYAPLFGLFSDWRKVRFVGAMILQGIMVASYGLLCRALGHGKRAFWAGGALLLLPTSVAYGRIVLYQTYYIPHIAISFALSALVALLAKGGHSEGRGAGVLSLIGLIVLSFLSGVGGVRQIAVTHVPLCLALCLWAVGRLSGRSMAEGEEGLVRRRFLGYLGLILLSGLAFGAGYWVNRRLLSLYHFSDYLTTAMAWRSDRLSEIAFSILHAFGLRRDIPLFSVQGVASLLGVLAFAVLLRRLSGAMDGNGAAGGGDFARSLAPGMLAAGLTVFVLEELLLDKAYAGWYVLPYSVWMAPVVGGWIGDGKDALGQRPVPALRRVLVSFVAVAMVLNGVVNGAYYINPNTFPQPYEGNTNKQADMAERLSPLAELLVSGGYDLGYCTFWQGNILTEMTDGAIPVININVGGDGTVHYFNWLTLADNRSRRAQKVFAVIDGSACDAFEAGGMGEASERLFEDPGGLYRAYRITDPDKLKAMCEGGA